MLLTLVTLIPSLDNGLGRNPVMGYNTWYDFECSNISAVNIRRVTDRMTELGLLQLGYEYINIDDCWAVGRNSVTLEVIPDPSAFPDGMKAVADYVHSKGFKFGIYTDRGTQTCAGRPGSQGVEAIDAATYAKWGVDFVKEDSCYAPDEPATAFYQYGLMRDALNQTGRPILFSLCGWRNWYAPAGNGLANMWRMADDVVNWGQVWLAISANRYLASYAGPGGYNDPDMLLGSSDGAFVKVSPTQSRTQFSLWAVMAAPLIIGAKILDLSDFDLATYTNKEVIAIDQDPLGVQGTVIWENCPVGSTLPHHQRVTRSLAPSAATGDAGVPECQQVWFKPLSGGGAALLLVNYALSPATVDCDARCFAIAGIRSGASVRDVWSHQDLGKMEGVSVTLEANGGSVLYRLQ